MKQVIVPASVSAEPEIALRQNAYAQSFERTPPSHGSSAHRPSPVVQKQPAARTQIWPPWQSDAVLHADPSTAGAPHGIEFPTSFPAWASMSAASGASLPASAPP